MNNLTQFPSFIIAGAPKAGTTSLNRLLNTHPKVYIPKQELNYFSFCDQSQDLKHSMLEVISDQEHYQSFFQVPHHENGMIFGEKSVSYIYPPWCDRVIRNIKQFHPEPDNLRIIIVLRQPVDRMYSQYFFNRHFDETLSFEEALKAWPERKARQWVPAYDYTGAGFYAEAVEKYKAHFKDVGVYLYDDLESDLTAFLNKIAGLLEIDPLQFDQSGELRYNRGGIPLNGIYNQLYKWYKVARQIYPAKTKANRKTSGFAKRMRSVLLHKPALDHEVRNSLTKMFVQDIVRLQSITGYDLNHWLPK